MLKKYLIQTYITFTATLIFLSACASSSPVESKLSPQQMMKKNLFDQVRSQFQMPSDINGIDEEGNTVLHLAAKINDADLCTFFILKGADPEIKNYQSDTALHVAIRNNSFEAAKVIAATTNCLFARDADGITALDLGLSSDIDYYDMFITTKAGEVRDTEGKTIVHYFVETKNQLAVETCIKKKIPISVKDNNGKTPLDIAFENIEDQASVEIAALLIMSGADEVDTAFSYFQNAIASRNLSSRFDDGQTPLHLAAIYGHTAIANYLLENNADTTAQDSSGASPLHEAIRYGHLEIARQLLSAGANVDAKDNLGKSPIMLILPKDKIKESYNLLISFRANLNIKDMYGDTILHTASMMNVDIETIQVLTRYGADINARNKEGSTPLAIAVQKGYVETARLFTNSGASIHTQDTNENSPLTIALTSSEEMLEAVVNRSNVLTQDSYGNTPLQVAIQKDASLAKIQYIISLTEDVNTRNKDGNSALFMAVMKNRQKVGELLLAKNADIFATNKNNNSPLRLALRYGGSVQDWLITSKTIRSTDGSGNSVLHYAAEWQYEDAINFLLVKGADINARNANGETVLFSAAKSNNPKIIQIVVDGGANIKVRDNLGSTPIHMAVRWDAQNSIRKLIDLGLDIRAQNSSGKSALSEAVLAGKYDTTAFILNLNADPNCCDANGVTVLMDAIKGGNKDIVSLLVDYGANPNIQDINGRNAFHEAAFIGNREIISMVRDYGVNPLSRDKAGNTPFSLVMNKPIDTILEVLGNSKTITDSDGNTPIHLVVKSKSKNSEQLLEFLIDEAYPLDTRNSDGYTPLNLAIEANDLQKATTLLANDCNPFQMIDKRGRNGVTIALEKNNKQMLANIVKYAGSKTDVQGNTILHYAARISSADTIKTLLSYGLNKNLGNVSGETPYTIAARWKRSEIVDILK